MISVVTDNYDMVMQKIVAIDCQYRAQLMYEVESVMSWNRNKGIEKYLFHAYFTGENTTSEGDEMHGKFRKLKNQIQEA